MINLKAEIVSELTNSALRILHHDGDLDSIEVKAEVVQLKAAFGHVLEPVLAERRKLYRKISKLETDAAIARL